MNTIVTNTALMNAGDAAILFATVGILRRALGEGLHVTACDQQADATQRLYPDLDIRPTIFSALEAHAGGKPRSGSMKARFLRTLIAARLWRTRFGPACERFLPEAVSDALDRIAGARVIVSAGGTYLVPHYRILPKLADLLCAHAMGQPYILFTQSLGPIPKGRDGRLLKFVLRHAKLVLVRDAQSRRHLKELRVRADRVIECADAAFALPVFASMEQPRRSADHNRRLRIAISVRDWPHVRTPKGMDAYCEAISALTTDLLTRHKAHVTFISTCQGLGEYWTDDSETAAAIVDRLDAPLRDQVWIDRDFHTPWQLMSLLGRFDAVVATRMHVAILALLAGVPVLPIAYEFKTSELFTNLTLGGLVQEMESITPEGLCAAFDHFLSIRRELSAMIPELVAKQRRGAMAAAEHVKEALAVPS